MTLEDTILPQQFTELSLRTIKNINNHKATYQTSPASAQENNEQQEEFTQLLQHGQTTLQLKTIPLQPKPDQTPVIAVDVSSIRLGETDTGILLALRAATTWKQKGTAYRYLRFGPFPIHVTDQNQHDILSLFHEHPSAQRNSLSYGLTSLPDLNQTQTRITALLEKWLQTQIASQTGDSLILLDGNLTANNSDQASTATTRLLQTARNHHNTILALTKITRLRLNGHNITELMPQSPKPCLLQLGGYQTTSHIHQLGAIYVAKLNHSLYTFRLDTDAETSCQEAVEAVEHLIGNDLITDGYPETLRLAHIYSTFTANEVIGIQRFLAQAYGIKIVQRPNIRRLLFGPYGTKHES
jgi:hypothetical protein